MKLHEILQIMADNAKPNAYGEICTNGHVMHNLLLNGKRIESASPSVLEKMMYSPELFSLAPRTHVVNGFTVPAPETEAPRMGQKYYLGTPKMEDWADWYLWDDDKTDHRFLERGNVFLTPEAAAANEKARYGVDPEWSDEK